MAVVDWGEGNARSAKTEAERAMRALLEGSVGAARRKGEEEGFPVSPEGSKRDSEGTRGGGGGEGVPVPLGLCLAGAAMLLVASTAVAAAGDRSSSSAGGSRFSAEGDGGNAGGEGAALDALSARDREEALMWLWRVAQVCMYLLLIW